MNFLTHQIRKAGCLQQCYAEVSNIEDAMDALAKSSPIVNQLLSRSREGGFLARQGSTELRSCTQLLNDALKNARSSVPSECAGLPAVTTAAAHDRNEHEKMTLDSQQVPAQQTGAVER